MVVFLGGLPPGGNRWLDFGSGQSRQRGNEISYNSSLRRSEPAVPYEIYINLASEKWAFVVFQELVLEVSILEAKHTSKEKLERKA